MLSGEIKKIIRNRVFLLIAFILWGMNLITILYCSSTVRPAEWKEKEKYQKEYVKSYDKFINEMDLRASLLLEMQQGRVTRYYKRNISKTLSDYKGLSNITLSQKYNVGMNEYVKYSYGIFFVIIFSFLGLYSFFLQEKENGLMRLLRAAKKGRRKLILSRISLFSLGVLFFSFIMEVTTIYAFSLIYGLGDLNATIQSVSVLRDCVLRISLKEGLIGIVLLRIFLSIVIAQVVFFFAVTFSRPVISFGVPVFLFGSQFVLFQTISIDSSLDYLHCLNVFCGWDMKKTFGAYHNLNIFGSPIEKNEVLTFCGICIILLIMLCIPFLFDKTYQEQSRGRNTLIENLTAHLGLLLLRQKRLFANECFKVFVMQKKWAILLVLALLIFQSRDAYQNEKSYQTSYEACYHMYLSNIEGPYNSKAEKYLKEQGNYLKSLQRIMQKALKNKDTMQYEAAMAEYDSREEGYNRIMQQKKGLKQAGEQTYWLDEFHFKGMIRLYGTSIVLFGVSLIGIILLLSGIFANGREVRMEALTRSTRNGQGVVYRRKICLATVLLLLIGFCMNIPFFLGLHEFLVKGNWRLPLKYLTDPHISSDMTVGGFFLVLLLIRCMLLLLGSACTVFLSRRSKNEFYTSVFLSGIVLVVCVVMYIFKTDLALILIHIMGGIWNGNYARN